MKLNRQNILLIILALSLVYAGWHFYNRNTKLAMSDISDSTLTEPVGLDILVIVQKLETLDINPEVLTSSLFTSLRDLSTPLSPEAQYRPDPFSPIGRDVAGTGQVFGGQRNIGR